MPNCSPRFFIGVYERQVNNMDEKSLALAEHSFATERVSLVLPYVDIAGDLIAGLMLSQIMYWFSPDKSGKSKIRIHKKDGEWIAKSRKDWYTELRISPKQCDRALDILENKKGLIKKAIHRFNGSPTLHIRPVWEQYNRLVEEWKKEKSREIEAENIDKLLFLPKGEFPNSPKGEMEIDKRVKTLTDTTTDITTESTSYSHNSHYSNYSVPFPDGNETTTYSEDVSECSLSTCTTSDVYFTSSLEGGDSDSDISFASDDEEQLPAIKIDEKIAGDNKKFNYDILQRQLNICIGEMPDKKMAEKYRDEIIDIFYYFYDAYEKVTSTTHPRLSNANIKKVIQMMFDKDINDHIYIDKLNYEQYTCSYFHCQFKGNDIGGCNYSILHFMTVIDDRDRDMETHAYDPETLLRV